MAAMLLAQLRPTKQDPSHDKQSEPKDKELRRVAARERQRFTRSAALDGEVVSHCFALSRARGGHLHDVGAIRNLTTELQGHWSQGALVASSYGHKVRDGSFALGGFGDNREVLSFGCSRHPRPSHRYRSRSSP